MTRCWRLVRWMMVSTFIIRTRRMRRGWWISWTRFCRLRWRTPNSWYRMIWTVTFLFTSTRFRWCCPRFVEMIWWSSLRSWRSSLVVVRNCYCAGRWHRHWRLWIWITSTTWLWTQSNIIIMRMICKPYHWVVTEDSLRFLTQIRSTRKSIIRLNQFRISWFLSCIFTMLRGEISGRIFKSGVLWVIWSVVLLWRVLTCDSCHTHRSCRSSKVTSKSFSCEE